MSKNTYWDLIDENDIPHGYELLEAHETKQGAIEKRISMPQEQFEKSKQILVRVKYNDGRRGHRHGIIVKRCQKSTVNP